MSPSTDLEALVQRLRDAASTLDAEQPPIAPPIGDWHRRLAELRDRPGVSFPLLDPTAPRLAELLALDLDDDGFLAGLYHHLLGREIDPEGQRHYLAECQQAGRLAVVVAVSDSEESARHCRQQAIRLPEGLQRARCWRHRLARLRGPGERLWRRTLQRVTRWRAPRWALDAALCRQLVQQRLWPEERHQLATAVLEMDDRQRHFGHRQDHEYARQQALWQQLAAWRRAVSAPAGEATTPSAAGRPAPANENAPGAAEPATPSELDAYYLAFEAAFRGPEADIAAHLDHYREAWTRARQAGDRALDLGCGRGEWLRLLRQAGFQPRGIDLNATMVAHCREQGFEVTQQDALAALREAPDAGLALVSGFHIAEHLPFEALFELVAEAHRALAPGGMLILETPNPENLIVASYSFYHDLTHRNPLTPPTLQFLLQFHGFGDAVIQRFNPPPDETRVPGEGPLVERLNAMLAAPMDYAVVGAKAASTAIEAPTEEGRA